MIKTLFRKIAKQYALLPPDIFAFLGKELPGFQTVMDVGAYHGSFAKSILTKAPMAKVHCFEPSPLAFLELQQIFNNNKNVVLNNEALSDKVGVAKFHINSFAETNSLLPSSTRDKNIAPLTQNEATTEVCIGTIDQYCALHEIRNVDFVKIDTQGNSSAVLAGAQHLLIAKSIKYLYVEAEFIEIYKGEKLFGEIVALMNSHGYKVRNIFNWNYESGGNPAWCDILFTK